jgi:acetyltransferase-like isoleucine patch superfamily enzyme
MSRSSVRIHPTAEVSERAVLGEGTSVWNQAQIREGARLGRGCIVAKDVYVDFDVVVGDFAKIQNGALLYHGLTLGNGVFVGPGAIFTNDRRPRAINADGTLKSATDWTVSKTVIDDGAAIGAGAVIVAGVRVGKWAMVGAGAIVTRDVEPHGLVVGNPARRIGWVCACGERLPASQTCTACGTPHTLGGTT